MGLLSAIKNIKGGTIGGALSSAGKVGLMGVKGAYQLGKGGPLSRATLGGIVGGISGYVGSDFQSNQLTLETMGRGALLGALAGGVLPGAAKTAAGMLWRNKMSLAKGGWSATKGAAKLGRFAFEHPLLAAGGVGGVMGIDYLTKTRSPTLNGITMNPMMDQEQMASQELTGGMGTIGTGYVSSAKEFMNSTQGLVSGLHRSRHG